MSKWKAVLVNDINKPKPQGSIRLMCLSDTHGFHEQIPKDVIVPCDIAIHAGDFSNIGEVETVKSFRDWFVKLPAKHKVCTAGNHELSFDIENREDILPKWEQLKSRTKGGIDSAKPIIANDPDIVYLEKSTVEIEGLKIYGSPYSVFFCDWAFQVWPQIALYMWDDIQEGTDIVITHGPPDGVASEEDRKKVRGNPGCPFLTRRIEKIQPSVAIFGHVHEWHPVSHLGETLVVGVSVINNRYQYYRPPVYIDMCPQ